MLIGQVPAKKLEVPFIPQGEKMCGPAVLNMAAKPYLPNVPFDTYKNLSFREKAEGTFTSDMLSATRRLGLAPYKVATLEAMLKNVSIGRPVMVFQNLGLSWYPMWHYALLVGYDKNENIVYLHSGFTEYRKMDFGLFKRTWRRGDYWSYIVVPPSTIPENVAFNEVLDNATTFENLKNYKIAQDIYSAMIKKWPDRFEPHLGLANMHYENKQIKKALSEMNKAYQLNPKHPALTYNLSQLYHELGNKKKAEEMKQKTLLHSNDVEKEDYLKKFKF